MKRRSIELATTAANLARQQQGQAAIERQKARDRASNHRAVYAGFDADTGRHQVKLPDGSRIQAKSVSNGGMESGDIVAVSRPKGGGAIVRSMPR